MLQVSTSSPWRAMTRPSPSSIASPARRDRKPMDRSQLGPVFFPVFGPQEETSAPSFFVEATEAFLIFVWALYSRRMGVTAADSQLAVTRGSCREFARGSFLIGDSSSCLLFGWFPYGGHFRHWMFPSWATSQIWLVFVWSTLKHHPQGVSLCSKHAIIAKTILDKIFGSLIRFGALVKGV